MVCLLNLTYFDLIDHVGFISYGHLLRLNLKIKSKNEELNHCK